MTADGSDERTWYFDLDGTLVEYDAPFSTVYETALDRLGVEPRGEIVFSETFFDVVGEVENPLATAIDATDVDVDPAAFCESMAAAESAHVRAKPGASALLESLSETCRLGVLTNGLGRIQRRKLEAVGLSSSVDVVVVAEEVDAWKPDPEIYRIAERRLPADSYTFVADDLERDLRPAVERGWRGIRVDSDTAGAHKGKTAAAHERIESIADLRELGAGVPE